MPKWPSRLILHVSQEALAKENKSQMGQFRDWNQILEC